MAQSTRSSSVPLIHIDNLRDNDNEELMNAARLPRNSFSLSSIQPPPWSHQTTTTEVGVPLPTPPQHHHDLSDDDSLSTSDTSSSSSSDDEASIAIPGRKTMAVTGGANNQQINAVAMDLSSDILYEDIWIDSPVFHEHLQSLETWLCHYLTWLEKIEQCRQLEIAYSKSIALLSDQTKLMLNEPFYTEQECNNLNWPDHNGSLEEEEIWDKQDIRSILPYLRDHGTKIKETLTYFEGSVTSSRVKHLQLSNNYCAIQKLKSSQANNKTLDEASTALYVAKKSLCKVLLDYIYTLNNLIKSTRNLVNEKLSPLFEGLQSDKHRNLKTLEELVLIATDFIYDVNSKKSTSSSSSSATTSISSGHSQEDSLNRSASPFITVVQQPRSSFEDYHELNNERLSYYIQEKLASYYSCLKNSLKRLPPAAATPTLPTTAVPNDLLIRSRPSSPTYLIPFTFLNKPRLVQKYNSLDSLLTTNPHSLLPSGFQLAAKGYLLTKKKSTNGANSNCTNGMNKDAMHHHHGGKWERYYFYISKDDGHLKQYKDPATTIVVTNLKTAIVHASETDKRDFVIQIASTGTSHILGLQAETAVDFSTWLQALRSWNPHQQQQKRVTTITHSTVVSRKSSIPRTSGTQSSNRSFLTKKSSLGPNDMKKIENNAVITTTPTVTTVTNTPTHPLAPNTLRASPTNFVNNAENNNGELLFGYPISANECPINCCNSNSAVVNNSFKIQMTGLFRIHKLCINKLSCTSHHTGTLCVLHVTLFENGVLHLQTEKDDNAFFHRPIHLNQLSPQDIYPFSDSINHMRYCIVIRPQPSETYHLMTCSKVQRDAWLVRLKRSCGIQLQQQQQPSGLQPPPRTIYSLTVRIAEGRKFQVSHKDSIHSELYCDIVIDNEIRGLTGSLKKTSTLFWREEFLFSDISKMRHGVTITIYSRSSKNDRENVYGTVFLPVHQIEPSSSSSTSSNSSSSGGGGEEAWYEVRKESRNRAFASLTSLGSSHGSLGQLRVGFLLEEHQVFGLDVYQPLMDVLTEFRHDVIYDMARKTSDVQGLARNLLRIYEGMGLTLTWIKSLIDYDVSSLGSDDVNILFRGNSFFTKVIDNYMKMSGKEFLEEALQFTIQKICKFSLHIEVESSRLSNSTTENTLANCSELFSHVRSIWGGIQRAKTKCPIELRRIFGHLQSAIVQKFDLGSKEALDRHHEVARYTCVSGFIFLRWICPAIISPKQFGLVQDHPDTKTCRTLTLIAKCLMTLASHSTIEQNAKEPWMVRLNEFVQNNTHHFMNFINFVSVDDEEDIKTNEGILLLRDNQEEIIAPYFIDLALELSQFTSWCCSQECNVVNMITRTCKNILGLQQQQRRDSSANSRCATPNLLQQKRKTRPQPWQYGDDAYLENNASASSPNASSPSATKMISIVRSPSVAE